MGYEFLKNSPRIIEEFPLNSCTILFVVQKHKKAQGKAQGDSCAFWCCHIRISFSLFDSKFTVKSSILQLFLQFSCLNRITLQNFHYLCSGLGEKSRVADALAFISHLPKMSGKLFWNKFD